MVYVPGDPPLKNIIDFDNNKPFIPEKFLLTAILERAVRDLEVPTERREAITWFLIDEKTRNATRRKAKRKGVQETGFYFLDVVEALELSSSRVNAIKHYIKLLDEDAQCGKRETEGQKDRIRNSSLATRAWFNNSSQKSTVQRRRRRGRYCS